MRNPEYQSVLTVLRNFFGKQPSPAQLTKLSRQEVEELRDLVLQFSENAEFSSTTEAIYPGSWLAGNWLSQPTRLELHQNILYHDALITHDPLADFFGIKERWFPEFRPIRAANGSMSIHSGPHLWNEQLSYEAMRDSLDEIRRFLAHIIPYLFELGPLLDNGIILPRPQWRVIKERKQALSASVRQDAKSNDMVTGTAKIISELGPLPIWDNLYGLRVHMTQPVKRADKRWEWQYESYQLAKQLAFADEYDTTYIPQSAAELELLRLKITQLSQEQETSPRPDTLEELSRLVLPDLELPAKTAIEIRQDEESFQEWKETVRRIDRESATDTPHELKQRIEDTLAPISREIDKTSRRASIKKFASQDALVAVLTAVGTFTAATVVGAAPIDAMVPAAGGGVLGWLGKMFLPAEGSGSDASCSFCRVRR